MGWTDKGRCNLPCPNHITERCGGETNGDSGIRGRSLITVFGEDPPPVSGVSVVTLFKGEECSVLCEGVVGRLNDETSVGGGVVMKWFALNVRSSRDMIFVLSTLCEDVTGDVAGPICNVLPLLNYTHIHTACSKLYSNGKV
jgi:hypothetical protein